jgi:Carboxypeptidase regulatory-like domain
MKYHATICLFTALSPLLAQPAGPRTPATAKLYGTVTDSVLNSFLIGAGVALRDANFAFIKGTITEPDGTYNIDGLTTGRKYWVTFCQQNYDPVSSEVIMPSRVDQKLNMHDADRTYWNRKAEILFSSPDASSEAVFATTWGSFQTSAVSAEGKGYVAQAVQQKFKDSPRLWTNLKDFSSYAAADPSTLNVVEQSIWSNKSTDPKIFEVNRGIIEDIRARKARLSPNLSNRQPSPADPCGYIY